MIAILVYAENIIIILKYSNYYYIIVARQCDFIYIILGMHCLMFVNLDQIKVTVYL